MAYKNSRREPKCIEYSKTIVPTSMRSPYWKFFGFPSDVSNNILTKDKIICTICGSAIAYNRNTSNLRTHLVSKHSEVISDLVFDSSAMKTLNCKTDTEEVENLVNEEGETMTTKDQTHNTIEYKNQDNQDCINLNEPETQCDVMISSNDIEYSTFPPVYTSSSEENENLKDCVNTNDSTNYSIEDLIMSSSTGSMVTNPNYKAVVDAVINALMPLDYINGFGFQQLLHGDGEKKNFISKIKALIKEKYLATEYEIRTHLENFSRITLFSLGVEMFTNFENYETVHLYVTYYDSQAKNFKSVLYKTCQNREFDLKNITKNLCMDNCIAIITCSDGDFKWTNLDKIPHFQSFGFVLTKILEKVFDQDEIASYFEYIYEKKDLLLTDNSLAPDISPKCPWSKLDFLHYTLVHGDYSIDLGSFDVTELLEFCEYMTPFRITLETISEENLPLCSIISPLITKLMKDHFTTNRKQNKLISKIAPVIESEFQKFLDSQFFQEASFFDVRFQNHLEYDEGCNRDAIQESILSKFNSIIDSIPYASMAPNNKASLRNLFERFSDPNLKKETNEAKASINKKRKLWKTNVDIEFDRYTKEISIEFELCPLEWWKLNNIKYSELSKVAKYYLSVPCCIPKLDNIDPIQRQALLKKRLILSYFSVENHLWYLHFNQNYYEQIKSM